MDEKVWDKSEGSYEVNFQRALPRVNDLLSHATLQIRRGTVNISTTGPTISAASLKSVLQKEMSAHEARCTSDAAKPTGPSQSEGGDAGDTAHRRNVGDLLEMKSACRLFFITIVAFYLGIAPRQNAQALISPQSTPRIW